jgi:hypothetical protein
MIFKIFLFFSYKISVHNTWEPIENFDPTLIDDYEKKLSKAKPKPVHDEENNIEQERKLFSNAPYIDINK